jgi:hypothetical protein
MKIETPNFKLHGRLKKIYPELKINKHKLNVLAKTFEYHNIDPDILEDMDIIALMIIIRASVPFLNEKNEGEEYKVITFMWETHLSCVLADYKQLGKTQYQNINQIQRKLELLNLIFYAKYERIPGEDVIFLFLMTPELCELLDSEPLPPYWNQEPNRGLRSDDELKNVKLSLETIPNSSFFLT